MCSSSDSRTSSSGLQATFPCLPRTRCTWPSTSRALDATTRTSPFPACTFPSRKGQYQRISSSFPRAPCKVVDTFCSFSPYFLPALTVPSHNYDIYHSVILFALNSFHSCRFDVHSPSLLSLVSIFIQTFVRFKCFGILL